MARRAGLEVAHLEAGLRSHHLLHPFPEELIRIVVMRAADVLFAPDAEAVRNLAAMRVKGEVVRVSANTVVESLAHDLRVAGEPGSGPAVVTMHRVENLNRRPRVDAFVRTAERIAGRQPVRFVVHGPTEETLRKGGHLERLERAGVEIVRLVPHGEFVGMLHRAPLVITDGGSIQEECALLGRADAAVARVVRAPRRHRPQRRRLALRPRDHRRLPRRPGAAPGACGHRPLHAVRGDPRRPPPPPGLTLAPLGVRPPVLAEAARTGVRTR